MLKFIINLENEEVKEVVLKDGLVIGRSKGDIIIPDEKISSTHAIVKSNDAGHFFLKDMSSTNGILIGDEKVFETFLIPGVRFKIGNTFIQVEEVSVSEEEAQSIKESNPISFLKDISFSDIDNLDNKVDAFDRPIELRFVRGPLNKISWKLYWGPARIGTHLGPYTLLDPSLENNLDLFEISKTSQNKSLFLKSMTDVEIKVNGNFVVKKSLIEDGDFVELAESAFYINFV